jgi:hypothetical protein
VGRIAVNSPRSVHATAAVAGNPTAAMVAAAAADAANVPTAAAAAVAANHHMLSRRYQRRLHNTVNAMHFIFTFIVFLAMMYLLYDYGIL